MPFPTKMNFFFFWRDQMVINFALFKLEQLFKSKANFSTLYSDIHQFFMLNKVFAFSLTDWLTDWLSDHHLSSAWIFIVELYKCYEVFCLQSIMQIITYTARWNPCRQIRYFENSVMFRESFKYTAIDSKCEYNVICCC